jgi:ABC-2 type transport system permease protein
VRLGFAYVRASTLELLRYPAYSLPALFFPTLLFLLFAAPRTPYADQVMVGFAAVAVLGVVFFQFGVGIAADRMSPWEIFLRTLPAPPHIRLGARVVSALAFAGTAATIVFIAAISTTTAGLPTVRWPLVILVLLLGAVPFAFLGIALGYLIWPRAALPVANLVYLPLSYAGGLWTGPRDLPAFVAKISPVVPTRAWGDLLWAAVGTQSLRWSSPLMLVGYGAVFGGLAILGYRRDEGERFN